MSDNLINLLKTTVTSQKIFGICNFLKTPAKIGNNVVFLNKLQDPGNIGTIIRMCRSFDIDTLILQNCDLYNEKIIRASQGAIFKLNILSVKNTEILKELKQNSYQVFATKLDENTNKINDVDFSKIDKKVIVFGNEGAGIDQEIDGLMDKSIYIPISFESLNVACAAAIVLNKLRNG
ncbi:rRNA methyltransferase [Mycoplasmopsis pullorum]|nr:rRNA methyltransferase [Mycoplasmopsis pullorum]